eukprot:6206854-Pleurochrysis_carterae.AAC.2
MSVMLPRLKFRILLGEVVKWALAAIKKQHTSDETTRRAGYLDKDLISTIQPKFISELNQCWSGALASRNVHASMTAPAWLPLGPCSWWSIALESRWCGAWISSRRSWKSAARHSRGRNQLEILSPSRTLVFDISAAYNISLCGKANGKCSLSSSELSIEPSNCLKEEDMLKRQKDEFSGQQACNCKSE